MQMSSGVYYLYFLWPLAEFQSGDGFLYSREDLRGENKNKEKNPELVKLTE